MFRNKIPEPCWIPEEPHQEVWNRTIGAGRGSEMFKSLLVLSLQRRTLELTEILPLFKASY